MTRIAAVVCLLAALLAGAGCLGSASDGEDGADLGELGGKADTIREVDLSIPAGSYRRYTVTATAIRARVEQDGTVDAQIRVKDSGLEYWSEAGEAPSVDAPGDGNSHRWGVSVFNRGSKALRGVLRVSSLEQGGGNDGAGLILRGTIVGPSGPFEGEVRIEGDTLTCVAAECGSAPAEIDTRAIILPGLVDAHNHTLFNTFDESDWSPAKVYTNHNQWPNDRRYSAMVDAKQWLDGESPESPMDLGCEMDKYGEIKALIAGTTSVAGAPNPANRACYGSLARTIDQSPNDLGDDRIQMQTVVHGTAYQDTVCEHSAAGETAAYVIHVAEGTDDRALAEFTRLGTITTVDGCLYAPQTTVVHGVALGEPELSIMAEHSMSLVWSPRSNVFLYGMGTDLSQTADIALARSLGLNIAIGPDWAVGGSPNLLDELRFADRVDQEVWDDILTPRDLFEMVTVNAARALGVGALVGSLEVGKRADLFVIDGDRSEPYDALLDARPETVRLTIVGGTVLYGDTAFEAFAPATPGCERIRVCGESKFLCAAEAGGTAENKLGQTFDQIRRAVADGLEEYDEQDVSEWDFSPIAPLTVCP